MKIKLSQNDKNLVAMCWLAEMILSSLVKCTQVSEVEISPDKKEMYDYISELFSEPHKKAMQLNDKFSEQITKVFDDKFQDTLCDLTLSIVTLYETMKPNQLLKIMKKAGISDRDILATYKNSK